MSVWLCGSLPVSVWLFFFFFFFFFFKPIPPTIWAGGPEWGWEATGTHLGGDRDTGPPPASLVSAQGSCLPPGRSFRWVCRGRIGPSATPVEPGLQVGFAWLDVPPWAPGAVGREKL